MVQISNFKLRNRFAPLDVHQGSPLEEMVDMGVGVRGVDLNLNGFGAGGIMDWISPRQMVLPRWMGQAQTLM